MAGTYSLKDIRVSITLDKGGANNQFVFQGFATNVSLSKTGGVDFATAQVEIYGLTLPVMASSQRLPSSPWIASGMQSRSRLGSGAVTSR